MKRTSAQITLSSLSTPVGTLMIACTQKGVCRVVFETESFDFSGCKISGPCEDAVLSQFEEYFFGERTKFTLPLDIYGTPFFIDTMQAVLKIPYGRTATYQQVAKVAGHPRAFRAVGAALAKNPVPILIPCHRVVGAHDIGGFSGGLQIKETLMRLEGIPIG